MTEPTDMAEYVLRTKDVFDELGLTEPPPEVLDRLAASGHDRNGFCDPCWAAAGERAASDTNKPRAQHYLDVIAEANAAAQQEES